MGLLGLPQWLSGKESTCDVEDAGDLGPDGPLEESMAAAPIFLPGESHGQRRLAGYS